MEEKFDRFLREFNDFKRQWDNAYREIQEVKRFMDELNRELGVRQGRLMYDQIDRMEQRDERREDKINVIVRDVESIKKLLEYNDINIKEVMKALSLIYRNVDELEEGLLPERASD